MIAKAGLSENKRKNLVLLSNDHRGKFEKLFSRSITNLIVPHEASYPFTEYSCLSRRMIEFAWNLRI